MIVVNEVKPVTSHGRPKTTYTTYQTTYPCIRLRQTLIDEWIKWISYRVDGRLLVK